MSRRSGFTLVEVMVVLAVTTMLTTMILVYSNKTRDTLRLFEEKAHITQLLLRSKSLALSTYAQPGVEAPCGYGVVFDRREQTYAMVAYKPADCADHSRVDIQGSSFNIVENASVRLPSAITFGDPVNTVVPKNEEASNADAGEMVVPQNEEASNGNPRKMAAPKNNEASYVIFLPPDPTVLIARQDGTLVNGGIGKVNLRITGTATGAIVTVNAAGQVTY